MTGLVILNDIPLSNCHIALSPTGGAVEAKLTWLFYIYLIKIRAGTYQVFSSKDYTAESIVFWNELSARHLKPIYFRCLEIQNISWHIPKKRRSNIFSDSPLFFHSSCVPFSKKEESNQIVQNFPSGFPTKKNPFTPKEISPSSSPVPHPRTQCSPRSPSSFASLLHCKAKQASY